MKKLFSTISFLLLAFALFAQPTNHKSRYFTFFDANGVSWNAQVFSPLDSANGMLRPAFIQWPGSGETGTGNMDSANANLYGVTRSLAAGEWDGRVLQDGVYVTPYYISLQRSGTNTDKPDLWYPGVQKIVDLYPQIDTNQLHLAGISLGGILQAKMLVRYLENPRYIRWASCIVTSPGGIDSAFGNNIAKLSGFAAAGGHILWLAGSTDATVYHYGTAISNAMNLTAAGSAVGRDWTTADGMGTTGHGGWYEVYKPTRLYDVTGNISMYQWALQYRRGGFVKIEPWMIKKKQYSIIRIK